MYTFAQKQHSEPVFLLPGGFVEDASEKLADGDDVLEQHVEVHDLVYHPTLYEC